MSYRINICLRIVAPQTFRVLRPHKSVATSTNNLVRSYVTNHVGPSSYLGAVAERRPYSQQAAPAAEDLTVDFEYVKKAINSDKTMIIDVREPEEVIEHGKIPNSVNIPLANVIPVLGNVTESEFQQIYQRSKPKEDTEMIFYCMIGKRSGKAQQNALNLGYKNAKNYLGSWTDWASKIQ